jgi:hypothetical protein
MLILLGVLIHILDSIHGGVIEKIPEIGILGGVLIIF